MKKNKGNDFVIYTGQKGRLQFEEAVLNTVYTEGWRIVYNVDGLSKIMGTKEINLIIEKENLNKKMIWFMLSSKDDEVIKLASALLKI